MAHTPEQSRIRVDQSLEERLSDPNITFEEIKEAMHAAAKSQSLVYEDAFNRAILHEVETPVPQKQARVITIQGVKHILEGADEVELNAKETELYRAVFSKPGDQHIEQQQQAQPRDAAGRFTADEQAELVRKSELELRFKRGEISASQYLEESNAVADYLQAQGVDLESLRTVSGQRFEASWAEAAATFAQQHPDWPGGEENKNLLGRVIEANGWMDAEDKAAALDKAYQEMKAQDALVVTPEQQLSEKLANAKSHSDVADALQSLRPAGSSGFFGR